MSKLPQTTSCELDTKHSREVGEQLMWSLLPHVSIVGES